MSTVRPFTESSLASQIREATSQHLELVAIEQPEEIAYRKGPEQVVEYFLDALSSYPPTVFRLPFTVVLLEVLDLPNESRSRKRKAKQLMKSLGRVVRKAVSPGDIVLRCSFNQFSLLLLGHDELSAGKLCERVKSSIRHYLYFHPEESQKLELEFAIAQHHPSAGDDLADLVFSNERTIRLARALGDGAIVSRSEAKDSFQSHSSLTNRLGESFDSTMLHVDDEKHYSPRY